MIATGHQPLETVEAEPAVGVFARVTLDAVAGEKRLDLPGVGRLLTAGSGDGETEDREERQRTRAHGAIPENRLGATVRAMRRILPGCAPFVQARPWPGIGIKHRCESTFRNARALCPGA